MHASSTPRNPRRVPLPYDERLRAHAQQLAERLLDVDDPRLVPVREVRPTSDGLDLVLEPESGARPLPELARAGLRPGQVVTLGVELAEALTVLHDAGLTHGRLRAEEVLIGRDGGVRLTGYGVTAVLGSAGRPADDLADLLDLLGGLDPDAAGGWLGPVRGAVEEGDHDARALAARLATAGPRPEPLPGAAPAGLPVPRPAGARHRASRGSRALVGSLPGRGLRSLALVVPGALAILLLAGWIGATASPEPEVERPAPAAEQPLPQTPGTPTPGTRTPGTRTPGTQPAERPAPAVPTPDWRSVLTQLDVARAGVLAAPDEARVADVDAPGSSAYADDLAAVRALESRHAVARGVRFDVTSVRVRSAGQWRADLEVVDALRPHTIVAHGVAGETGRPSSSVARAGDAGRRSSRWFVPTTDGGSPRYSRSDVTRSSPTCRSAVQRDPEPLVEGPGREGKVGLLEHPGAQPLADE